MKEFKITEQQINQVASILLELPAKQVLSAVDLLRNLPMLASVLNEPKNIEE